MDRARLLIMPSEHTTRLLARSATGATLVSASLPAPASHPEALPLLLEALGSFVPLDAALVVPAQAPWLATRVYPAWFTDFGGKGYDLQAIRGGRRDLRRWWGR
jgi:hypothetical protein